MTEQLQLRRGTAAQIAAFTGAQGEVVVDTTNDRIVVEDGSTAGGWPAAKLNDAAIAFTGGTINGVTIGATTPAAGAFTALGVNAPPPGAGIVNVSGSYQVGGAQISTLNLANGQTGTGKVALQGSPTFAGTISGPDGGSWGSGGINGSIIGGTTPAAASFTTLALARHAVSDANYTVAAGISTVAYTSITAARTLTLPASSSFNTGQQLLVVDESGSCSPTKTITLGAAGSDTIDGATSAVIGAAYGYVAIESNAGGKWTIVDQGPQVLALNGLTGNVTLAATDGAVIQASGSTVSIGGAGGMVNKFRNGTMDVWQRGTSSLTATTSGAYTADGWIVLPTGASVTAAQASGRLLTKNSLQVTGASSVTGVIVKQRIESLIAAAFCSQTVTVQAQVYNNTGAAITPTLTVKHATAPDTWSGTATDVGAVGLQACANGAWTQVAYTFAASASSYNGLEISFDFGNNFGSGSKTLQITELDIRVTPGAPAGLNGSAPPPELRPVASEFALCQRYLFRWAAMVANETYGSGFVDSTTSTLFVVAFPVVMRAAPTMSFSASGTFVIRQANVGSVIASSGPTLNAVGICNATVNLGASGLTVGAALLRDSGSTNSYIQASAEL
jgi:hypothetical protein